MEIGFTVDNMILPRHRIKKQEKQTHNNNKYVFSTSHTFNFFEGGDSS
jgi:hypothetical protein